MAISMRFLAIVGTTACAAAFAQQQNNPNLNDYETHLIRGLAQRQSAAVEYDRMAVEKSSEGLTKAVAELALQIHTAGHENIEELGRNLGAWGEVGRGPMDPRGRPPGPGLGGATGGAPGGPGGPPDGPTGPGRPPGGFNTPPGGHFNEALADASGGEFDRLYLLLTILQNEEMQRAIALHIESAENTDVNPELLAWTTSHVEVYRSLARKVQKAARGEGDEVDNPLNREGGAVGPPGR